jgi:glycosyltransferase involved in cell wall biosynthesis
MREHLESRAPCIYLPNYDSWHSCIAPTVSSRVKVVGIAHSDEPQYYTHIQDLAPYWDAVVGVSETITRSIAALAPGIEPRQFTIPYGVAVPESLTARGDTRSDGFSVVYAGRVVRSQKRAHDLVAIADSLRERGSSAHISIVGSGRELERIRVDGAASLGSGHLRILGPLSNRETLDVFARSDVFVLPSSYEGMPVSLLEAMAHGCVPVVSAMRSGVPEIVADGVNGFIVPIADAESFAERVCRLENDASLRREMRSRAYQTISERYGIERIASLYVELFEAIVAKPYQRPSGRLIPPRGLRGIETMIPALPTPLRRLASKLRKMKQSTR